VSTDIILLDGGMGQELIARSKSKPSPLWSAHVMMREPEIVEAVHREYIQAGAHMITLNVYSATPQRLARDASEDLFEPLQKQAIHIANRARAGTHARLAGCLPPLVASYHPEDAPDYETSLATYKRVVECQTDAVDVFLCETMSSVKEASTATTAAAETGKPAWCALSTKDENGTLLRSGEPLQDGIDAAIQAGASAILINCTWPEAVTTALPFLSKTGLPFGGYANAFEKADSLKPGGTVSHLAVRHDLSPSHYADHVADWIDGGATIIGGCCEVGPAHIKELARRFHTMEDDNLTREAVA